MTQHLRRHARPGKFALRRIRLIANALQQTIRSALGYRVAQIEQKPVAFDDALDLLRRVEARGRGAMAVLRLRRGAIEHPKALALRAQAPFDVFPIERVVGPRLARITAQQRRSEKPCTAART